MRILAILTLFAALGGCAEVTQFHKADGSSYYHVDCGNGLRLIESCAQAARRTCPQGYRQAGVRSMPDEASNRRKALCEIENRDREDGAPLKNCDALPRADSYFVCVEPAATPSAFGG